MPCPCGQAKENITHIVGKSEMYKEERDVLEEEARKIEGAMDKFSTLDSSEKTVAALRDRWWSQKAKQEWDKASKTYVCNT